MTELSELLKKLSLEFGIAGYDKRVRDIIISEIEPYSDKFTAYTDNAGAYIVHIENEDKPKLMVSAHMDEVGFMVTEICEDGRLRFGNVGGINSLVMCSKRVISENGVKGAIISKPIHLQSADERKEVTKPSEMYIDIGCDTKEEAEYRIVGTTEADPLAGLISNEAPLAKAILDKKAGQTVDVHAKKPYKVMIIKIK